MQLYQKETEKALHNFPISGVPFSFLLAQSIATIKKAAAQINGELKIIPKNISESIESAAQEIIDGRWQEQFVVDQFQAGAGTSMHMNVNEVIATRATQILHTEYIVHPNDHVNRSQSTNDVIPTAIKLTTIKLIDELLPTYENFCIELQNKAKEYKDILKVGRTHMQDAVPITLGQEFEAHAFTFQKDMRRLHTAKECLYELNLGGSAIGTAMNGSKRYIDGVTKNLSSLTGYPFFSAQNLIATTSYVDAFLDVAGILSTLAANLTKFMNDLRLLTSGPRSGFQELQFFEVQKGSSIMPGKVNPSMAEMMNQVCYQIFGNNQTILFAVQAGQLELNVMLPVVAKNLFESLRILNTGLQQFTKQALIPLTANTNHCQELFDKSLCMATSLTPKIGYDKTAALVQEAVTHNLTLKEVLSKNEIMSEIEYTQFFNPKDLTEIQP